MEETLLFKFFLGETPKKSFVLPKQLHKTKNSSVLTSRGDFDKNESNLIPDQKQCEHTTNNLMITAVRYGQRRLVARNLQQCINDVATNNQWACRVTHVL